MIEVLILAVDEVSESRAAAMLSQERVKAARRFVHKKDRLRSFGAGYLMERRMPHEGRLRWAEMEKPYYEGGPEFNVSHGGEYAVMAVGENNPVGVDVENLSRDIGKITLLKGTLAPEEAAQVGESSQRLLEIWTRREAVFKCFGAKGDIRRLPSTLKERVRIEDSDYYIKTRIYDGHAISVAVRDEEEEIYGSVIRFGTEERIRVF